MYDVIIVRRVEEGRKKKKEKENKLYYRNIPLRVIVLINNRK